jgi:thymidylate synthase (FAD)
MDQLKVVLDHGFVRLVSFMQPVEHFEIATQEAVDGFSQWTGDLEVVRNARTSYDAHWRVGEDAEKDAKLIHRLDRLRHTSPFEAMVFTFEVRAPIFVFRQWHRHRTQSYSEQSARYSELPELFYVPTVDDIKTQHATEKQMSGSAHMEAEMWQSMMEQHCANAFKLYRQMLENGVARETARIVLPLATYSHMFCTVNLHNLFHFIQLRSDEHAQMEIQVYSDAMLELIATVVPVCVQAFQIRTGVGVE